VHPQCLKCETCKEDLVGKQLAAIETGIYCANCYITAMAPKCGGCSDPITGLCLDVLNMKWHKQCFVCTECAQDLTVVPFFPHEGKPYCEAHYLSASAQPCERCAKGIVGAYFSAFEKQWHPECFVCEHDGHRITEGSQYHYIDGKVYCGVHLASMFRTICEVCHQRITGAYFSVNSKPMHQACATGAGHMLLMHSSGRQTCYPYDVLASNASLPPEVDVRFKETFLTDDDFERLFCMTRQAFAAQPMWKKKALKKEVGLDSGE
jgi:hypothetical protein